MTIEQVQVVLGEEGGPTEMRDVSYYNEDLPGGMARSVPVTNENEAINWLSDGTPVIVPITIDRS